MTGEARHDASTAPGVGSVAGTSGARTAVSTHGPDGRRLASEVSDHLDYLARISEKFDIADPVRGRFDEVVGQWSELHNAAQLWRDTAERLENAAADVAGKLGGIDAAWQGADADAFLAHMQKVGLAGNDVVDAMRALAEVLDHTAESVRTLVQDLVEVITDGADSVSEALLLPVDGEQRARKHIEELDDPAREIVESVADILTAFVAFCDEFDAGHGVHGGALDHMMPTRNWGFDAPVSPPAQSAEPAPAAPGGAAGDGAAPAAATPSGGGSGAAAPDGAASAADVTGSDAAAAGAPSDGDEGIAGGGGPELAEGGTSRAVEPSAVPSATAAPAAAAAGGAATAGMAGGMMPMGMMGGMGMGQGQAGRERQNSSRLKSNPEDVFGKPDKAAPPVLGDSKNKDSKNKDSKNKKE